MAKKYASLETLRTFLDNLKETFSDLSHKHTLSDITDYKVDSTLSSTSSNPVANRVLDAEFDAVSQAMGALETAIDGKANSSHNHDSRYYTESEIDSKLSTVNTSITNITSGSTPVKEAEHAESADTATNATNANHATSADSATSATSATKATQDASGNVITSHYETKSDSSAKLTEAKSYADSAATKVKNDLLNNAGEAYDTLKELGDLIDDNADAIDALETIASGKANATHSHVISDVTNLQSALDGKASSSHGTHVTYSTTAPVMDGTASVGSASTVARSDHRHPIDTSRASQTDLDALETVVAGKANSSHTHTIANITNLQTTLDGKAASSHTHTVSQISDLTATAKELNYMDGVTSNIQTQLDGKASSSHTHNYAGSSSAGGAATSANKVNSSLTVKLNGGTTEGTNLFTFNGSAEKSINITPSAIGASASSHTHDDRYYTESEIDSKLSGKANSSHGNHVPTTQTASNKVFLRNDNTWATVTPANIGAAASSHTHTVANISDLTATATELNYMDGVTSSVQTQLDGKAASGHSHSAATTSANGFMTSAMVTKLNGIATGANAYTHPTYTARTGVPTANQTPAFGGTFTVNQVNCDAAGHVTASTSRTITIPSTAASASAAGLVNTGAQTLAGVKTFSSQIVASKGLSVGDNILPDTAVTRSIGSTTLPLMTTFGKNFALRANGNNKTYGTMSVETAGTTSAIGVSMLTLGNNIVEGTADNARGRIRLYGTKSYYTQINGNATSANVTLTLPTTTGTLATTDNVFSAIETLAGNNLQTKIITASAQCTANTEATITPSYSSITGTIKGTFVVGIAAGNSSSYVSKVVPVYDSSNAQISKVKVLSTTAQTVNVSICVLYTSS